MRDEIIARAGFLLRDLHLPPVDAQLRLKDYFPDLELEERVRYVREARELAQGAAAELS
ncbi:hypothetical protein [Kitasatospora sp. MAP5-34]|uniref:hypothetical protein n=1 Tax=Kitasatospora sp. MAP5-34 TaxID=3035102 RepID=UPI002474793C|nr:hypothetical protein [Kitasatospora sp. MAP5-34]MDH6574888.1 hypothetical protein [Kitasatospora sp. MAP5-34]